MGSSIEDQKNQMVDIIEEAPALEYVITDWDNPNSVLNLTKNIPTVQDALKRLIIESPDLLSKDEGTLKKETHPTVTLLRIRMSFWTEYENCVSRGRQMKLAQIIGGICTEYYFKEQILGNNMKMAFILCPPTNYVVQVREALQAGMESLRQIVSAKVIDDEGFLMPKAADIVLKTVALLDMRVKGAIIQKVDQRSINYNLNQEGKSASPLPAPRNMEELEQQLKDVREKIATAHTRPMIGAPIVEEGETLTIDVKKTGGGDKYE